MKIFLDMDGCITDFVGHFMQHFKEDPNPLPDEILWSKVKEIKGFWSNMPWMSDGKILWEFVRQYDVKILTSPSRHDERSKPGKIEWVQRELGPNVEIIFARGGTKALHLKHRDILIDDLPKNMNMTEGMGILHTSATETIATLKKLVSGHDIRRAQKKTRGTP